MERPSDPDPHDEQAATAARQARMKAQHAELVRSGKALDLREAHKRCFESGHHGTINVHGATGKM